jgi:hypothetical protein
VSPETPENLKLESLLERSPKNPNEAQVLAGFEFDRDDAVIVIPIILLLVSFATPLAKLWPFVGFAAYYLVLLLVWKLMEPFKKLCKWVHMKWFYRCAYCKSREIFLQGYQGYHSDEHYGYWLCNQSGETSIHIGDRFIKSQIQRKALAKADEEIPF